MNRDLAVALALLEQVANDPQLDPSHRRALCRAQRELRQLRKVQPVRQHDVCRVVRLVSESLWNAVAANDDDDDNVA